jgi:hypothetical protein
MLGETPDLHERLQKTHNLGDIGIASRLQGLPARGHSQTPPRHAQTPPRHALTSPRHALTRRRHNLAIRNRNQTRFFHNMTRHCRALKTLCHLDTEIGLILTTRCSNNTDQCFAAQKIFA